MDMRLGTWNVTSSLVTVSKELSKYKLHLVGVQEVSWEEVAPNQQENTYFFTEREMRIKN
jgi:hypothetical protein